MCLPLRKKPILRYRWDARIPELWSIGQTGILGLVPETFDGHGMTQHAYCRDLEQLAGHWIHGPGQCLNVHRLNQSSYLNEKTTKPRA
jgi:hypothetical protein